MARINLRRIEVFRAVYENSTVSAAARKLNITQPTISRMLKDFELDLGFKLFELERGRMRPTPEADRLHQESAQMFEHVTHIARVAEQLRSGQEGVLRVSAASFLAHDIRPTAALQFADAHPNIKLQLGIKNLDDQRAALLEGKLDLGIAAITKPEPGISQQVVGKGYFVCLVPENNALANARNIRKADLKQHRRLTGQEGTPLMTALLQQTTLAFEQNKAITVNSPLLAARLASMDNSVLPLDYFSAVGNLQGNTIKPFEKKMHFDICAQHLDIRPLSHIQRVFLGFIKQALIDFEAAHNVY
jgi:DNA-binding transcriptional LysR family regulator